MYLFHYIPVDGIEYVRLRPSLYTRPWISFHEQNYWRCLQNQVYRPWIKQIAKTDLSQKAMTRHHQELLQMDCHVWSAIWVKDKIFPCKIRWSCVGWSQSGDLANGTINVLHFNSIQRPVSHTSCMMRMCRSQSQGVHRAVGLETCYIWSALWILW